MSLSSRWLLRAPVTRCGRISSIFDLWWPDRCRWPADAAAAGIRLFTLHSSRVGTEMLSSVGSLPMVFWSVLIHGPPFMNEWIAMLPRRHLCRSPLSILFDERETADQKMLASPSLSRSIQRASTSQSTIDSNSQNVTGPAPANGCSTGRRRYRVSLDRPNGERCATFSATWDDGISFRTSCFFFFIIFVLVFGNIYIFLQCYISATVMYFSRVERGGGGGERERPSGWCPRVKLVTDGSNPRIQKWLKRPRPSW